ncbi:MAG: DUF2191 domain-containing protein [Actinobacteria bacterium]|uniref:Unannotated protein n=1 Tax=freshwater metagenome TaxID=449393 RepID=A0A6J7ESY9_9ZZZZ|nr:DUF2191 domain-containing protein [Actinomycetota bacterium]
MRTTLTLDDDLAMVLQDRARMTGRPFKEVVNACLRRGLAAESEPPREPMTVRAFDAGLRDGIDLTKALDLVAEMDDERFIAVTQELAVEAGPDDRP